MTPLRRTHRDRRLFELANRQYGLIRHDQLIALGVAQHQVQAYLRNHRLTRVEADVYALGHTVLRDEGTWLAALWACGASDVLSHFTAGAFHGWRIPAGDGRIHLSTTDETTSRGDLAVHRVKSIPVVDVFRKAPFVVTTIPRTLVDLADVMDWQAFRRLADDLPSLDIARIRAAQDRAPGRAGRGRVRRLIEADDAHTKSEFERRFVRFCRRQGLPHPDELNHRIAGHSADCVYLGPRLVVELDGRAFHERRSQMRADRHRDTDYQLAGFRVLRLVWDDLHADETARTVARLRAFLAST
ncbi:endonuclease domain-containing protein [Paraconexibacter antarcticus]|uniref:Endonuclease domain-containing protein n=1 Tax=Paraconexibacter antarcticus TaxID=2949664 RepID=A0ABY5DWR1_9ACTN|nr:DUF559 domain-containing protein [Paraconexibacter antarcticus]UTI65935.1 endonuclease domain-containing protein [Paraconexibacter antarcticus]